MEVDGLSSPPIVPGEPSTSVIVDVDFPLTLEFNISHNIFAAANVGNFTIHNLSAGKKNEISFNQFLKARPYRVVLQAGYISQQTGGLLGSPKSLPVVFDGYANVAYSERNGAEVVTRINAFDNGDITSGKPAAYFPDSTSPIPAKTSWEEAVRIMMTYLKPLVQPGEISIDSSQTPEALPRPIVLSGSVWLTLQALVSTVTGAHLWIENGVCNVLGQDNFLETDNNLGVLESATGLLGIPLYTGATILVSSVFEPALKIGARIVLQSKFNQKANGLCKIVGYTHRGVISGVQSGDATSDIILMKLDTKIGNPS